MAYTPIPQGTPDWDVPVNAAFVDQDGRITSNTSNIATASSEIDALQANDVVQDADIDALQTLTATHTSDIATNTANIATNTSNIATNTTNIATNASNITTLQTQSAQVRNGHWLPSDHGLVAWNIDPSEAANSQALTSGTVVYMGLQIRAATSFSNIIVPITSPGVTLTAGQNLAGLYDSTGTRVAVSADQSANWTTVGAKVVPMTGAPIALSPGLYFVAVLSNGTTPITMLRETNITNGTIINIGLTAATARASELAGQTGLSASITLSSRTLSIASIWTGIS